MNVDLQQCSPKWENIFANQISDGEIILRILQRNQATNSKTEKIIKSNLDNGRE